VAQIKPCTREALDARLASRPLTGLGPGVPLEPKQQKNALSAPGGIRTCRRARSHSAERLASQRRRRPLVKLRTLLQEVHDRRLGAR
jgi:hypothetical protein